MSIQRAPKQTPPTGPNDEKEKKRVRYVVGIVCSIGGVFLLYHASSVQKGSSSAIAGILVPAAIMVTYLVWVMYSTRANRQRTALLAAAIASQNNQQTNAVQPTTPAHSVINMPDNVSISSQASISSSARDSSKKLSAVPSRLRSSSMHQSTDSLSSRIVQPHTLERSAVAVHGSNLTLAASSSRPHNRSSASVHRQALGRSTLHLNNTRQLAAAVATLPSYKEAVNKSNWVLDKNHSMETLLGRNKK